MSRQIRAARPTRSAWRTRNLVTVSGLEVAILTMPNQHQPGLGHPRVTPPRGGDGGTLSARGLGRRTEHHMSSMVDRAGLAVADVLATFIKTQALPGLTLAPGDFWRGLASSWCASRRRTGGCSPQRDELQAQIDAWHEQRRGQPIDGAAYRAFLHEIGYLVPEPAPFAVATRESRRRNRRHGRAAAGRAGAQCALRCSMPPMRAGAASTTRSTAPTRSRRRGRRSRAMTRRAARKVIAWAKAFLDQRRAARGAAATPMSPAGPSRTARWRPRSPIRRSSPAIAAMPAAPGAILLKHNGLHIELRDRPHPSRSARPIRPASPTSCWKRR